MLMRWHWAVRSLILNHRPLGRGPGAIVFEDLRLRGICNVRFAADAMQPNRATRAAAPNSGCFFPFIFHILNKEPGPSRYLGRRTRPHTPERLAIAVSRCRLTTTAVEGGNKSVCSAGTGDPWEGIHQPGGVIKKLMAQANVPLPIQRTRTW
jgi:hypothetical protein